MNKTLRKAKEILTNIKQLIDDWCEEQDRDMEEWKEEDPEAYYEYMAQQEFKRY